MESGNTKVKQQVFVGQLAAAGILLIVATSFFSPVYSGAGWYGPAVGSVLLSFGIGVPLGRSRLRWWYIAPIQIFSGFLYLLLAVLVASGDFNSFGSLGEATFNSSFDGFRETLSTTLPIESGNPIPVGFLVNACWVAGASTGYLLTRTSSTAMPTLPAILLATLSLPLAAPTGETSYLLVAGLVASALLLSLVRSAPAEIATSYESAAGTEITAEKMLTERLISGVPLLVLIGLGAPLVALLLPMARDDPFDPRSLQEESTDLVFGVNPLSILKSTRQSQNPAFSLQLPTPPSATIFDRMGLASLDEFTGANWTSDQTFTRAPSELGVSFGDSVETVSVAQVVTRTDRSLPWLPFGGEAVAAAGDGLWYDERSGRLVTDERIENYQVTSLVALRNPDDLRERSLDISDPRYLDLPPIPADSIVNDLSEELAGSTDYDRLLALQEALSTGLTLVLDGPSGTSIGRLETFLEEGEGYRDQFVSAFAVAARQQGIPTRITVGYRITESGEDGTPTFIEDITAAQFDAWPEVRFEGVGWVPFDPVPASAGISTPRDPSGGGEEQNATTAQGIAPREAGAEENDSPDDVVESSSTARRVAVVAGLFVLFFPLMLLLLIYVLKLIRRRYRENLDDPSDRVLAGWQESKDRLIEAGVDITPNMTVKEIVGASRVQLGVPAAATLAAQAPHVTATIYSPVPPSVDMGDVVWGEVDLLDQELRHSRGRLRTVRARVDPRPLIERA